MSHSIAQELTMLRGCTMDEADECVQQMKEEVADGTDPRVALADEGLEDHSAWIAELEENSEWEPILNEHRACYGT